MGLLNKIFKKKDDTSSKSSKDLGSLKNDSKSNKASSKSMGNLSTAVNGGSGNNNNNTSKSNLKAAIAYEIDDCEEVLLNNIVIDNFFVLNNESRFNVIGINNMDKSLIFYKVWRTPIILQHIFKHFTISKIPSQSSTIIFTDLFNKKVTTDFIPVTTKSVTFGRKFNQHLEPGSIPSSVTYLKFGAEFSPLSIPAGVFPDSIKTLIFGQYFHTQFSRISLPLAVETLVLARCNTELLAEKIPKSVVDLTLGEVNGRTLAPGDINESVTTLSLDYSFTNKNLILEPGSIPNTVKTLIFGPSFNQPLVNGCIPDTISSLTFGNAYNQPLTPGLIGQSVSMLVFGESFNQTITAGCIPDSVNILEFVNYNKPFTYGALSNSIIYLDLGKSYNMPLANLPENLRSLKLGQAFKQQITFDALPQSISEIYLVPTFDKTLISYDIPKHILKVLEKN